MKLLTDWGFTRTGWRNNQRGEYWVVAQAILILGFILLPVYPIPSIDKFDYIWYMKILVATALEIIASVFVLKGLLDLGNSLTPLPYPKDDGQLVQSGVYSLVRHPLYSGIIFAALGWTVFNLSLLHLIATAILFSFFDAKAGTEEVWLTQKYPDYPDYQQRVKKLIPWVY